MKLFIKHNHGKETLIAEPSNRKEVIKAINKFLDKDNYKSHYMRIWEENQRLKFDYGSWSKFFYLEGMTLAEWIERNDMEMLKHGEVKTRR